MPSLEEARKIAMSLATTDRAALADELLQSLPVPPAIDEEEFVRILEERADAFERGETTASDWRESVARIRARLERELPNAAQD